MSMRKLDSLEFQAAKIHATPLYAQLSTVFRELITQSKWPQGTALPSEAELARKYGVSVGTARKALETLEDDGWITRKQGRGTFVSDPGEKRADRACKMSLVTTGENVFADCVSETLQIARTQVNAEEAEALSVPRGASVLRIHRRFLVQGRPVMLERQALRADMFPGLENVQDLPADLAKIFQREFGITVRQCTEALAAVAADTELSAALGCDLAAPLVALRRKVEDDSGVAVAYVCRWFLSHNVDYRVALS